MRHYCVKPYRNVKCRELTWKSQYDVSVRSARHLHPATSLVMSLGVLLTSGDVMAIDCGRHERFGDVFGWFLVKWLALH